MGWTNNQAENIVGLAFTYFTTTVLFSTGSTVTWGVGSAFESHVDLELFSPAGIVWDGSVRLDLDSTGLEIDGRPIMTAHGDTFNHLATPDTTTSAAYSDILGSSSLTITKHGNASGLWIMATASMFSTATATIARIACNVNGTDTDLSQLQFDAANVRQQLSGTRLLEVGSAPGSYTVTLRWRRFSGAGTLSRTAVDIDCMSVWEG